MKRQNFPWRESGANYCTGLNGERICTGAKMGRRDEIPSDKSEVLTLHLRKVRMTSDGCYDQGGAYWGQSETLYCSYGWSHTEEKRVVIYVRAQNREEAKAQIREELPNVLFY